MKFQTPQFIDVEDKIIGPLTFKQFAYVVGGGGMCFVLFELLPFYLSVLFIIPIAGLSLALAFYKINNKPFINTMQAWFEYMQGAKLYVWKRTDKPVQVTADEVAHATAGIESLIPHVSDSKLKDMSWSLGVQESLYAEETANTQHPSAPAASAPANPAETPTSQSKPDSNPLNLRE